MALLERIKSMTEGGMSEAQIQNSLLNEGVSPREINEAFSQAKIKAAVASESDMQQSIMAQESGQQFVPSPEPQASFNQAAYPPAPEPQASYQNQPAQDYNQQGYETQAYDQTSQQYPQQAYYTQALDLETVKDISRQQVEEGLRKMRTEVSELAKLKSELKFEMQDIENRLVKVEEIIHELQSSIIRKMGEYGESIQGISKEIRATQDSFAKVINPVLDKKRGINPSFEKNSPPQIQEQIPQKQKPKQIQESQPSQARSENSASFEDYFR